MYKLAVFDFDGTLADTFPWFVKTAQAASSRFRLGELDPSMMHELRGMRADDIISRLSVPRWKLPLIAAYARYKSHRECSSLTLFPKVGGLLGHISESGVSLAIVTSNSHATVRRVLGDEILSRIDEVECGSSLFGKAKKLERLLRRMRVDPHEAVYIGDEIRDCDAARKVGMAFAAVAWGYTRAQALADCAPDHMLVDVSDLRCFARTASMLHN